MGSPSSSFPFLPKPVISAIHFLGSVLVSFAQKLFSFSLTPCDSPFMFGSVYWPCLVYCFLSLLRTLDSFRASRCTLLHIYMTKQTNKNKKGGQKKSTRNIHRNRDTWDTHLYTQKSHKTHKIRNTYKQNIYNVLKKKNKTKMLRQSIVRQNPCRNHIECFLFWPSTGRYETHEAWP